MGTLTLAKELGVPDGDAQYALVHSRLTGDRLVSIADQIEIRLKCWRKTLLPPAGRRMRGAVGRINSPGWNGEPAILRSFGRPTMVITQKNVGGVADFEYVSAKPTRNVLAYAFVPSLWVLG